MPITVVTHFGIKSKLSEYGNLAIRVKLVNPTVWICHAMEMKISQNFKVYVFPYFSLKQGPI